jgi:hypothetical protein
VIISSRRLYVGSLVTYLTGMSIDGGKTSLLQSSIAQVQVQRPAAGKGAQALRGPRRQSFTSRQMGERGGSLRAHSQQWPWSIWARQSLSVQQPHSQRLHLSRYEHTLDQASTLMRCDTLQPHPEVSLACVIKDQQVMHGFSIPCFGSLSPSIIHDLFSGTALVLPVS